MAPMNKLSLLALASTVFATPFAGHGHGHNHKHARDAPPSYGAPAKPPTYGQESSSSSSSSASAHGTGSAGHYPYPSGNSTGIYGSTGISKPTAPAGYGSSSSMSTATEHSTRFSTVYSTVHVNYNTAGAHGGGGMPAASASTEEACAPPVTVTHTEYVTATIPAGYSVPTSSTASPSIYSPVPHSSSSSPVSPVKPSSPPAYHSAPSYSAPHNSSTPVAPVPASSAPSYSKASSSASTPVAPVAPSTTPSYSSASSSSSAPVAPAYTAPNKQHEGPPAYSSASSTQSAPPAYSSPSSTQSPPPAYSSPSSTQSAPPSYTTPANSTSGTSGGKRGIAYNDASLTTCFDGSSEVTWAYNWGSSSNGLSGDLMFIPTLWGTGSEFVNSWSANAQAAISSGSTHLFSFNEPDVSSQANMGCSDAASAYATYMNPFKGQAQLCAPSVSNGGGDMGLTWLQSFLNECTDCQIDCINIHWYDSAENTDYFKSHVTQAISIANGKPVYITEFGATGSDDQVNAFLQEVMPWLDSNSGIAGYAYFMAEDGKLISGTSLSTYGSTYSTYTS